MYIPEFWCGVAVTIAAAFGALVIAAAFTSKKK